MPSYDRDYMRPQRPSFGGGGGLGKPRVPQTAVGWVIVSCAAIFLLQLLFPPFEDAAFVHGTLSLENLQKGRIWTLFTHMFLHGGWLHIIGNMFLVWFAGKHLENILGSRRFLIIFFAGGLVGAVAQLLIHNLPLGHFDAGLVGASGGAFALLIAYAMLNPEQELFLLLYFVIPVRMRAKNLARGLVVVSVVLAAIFLYREHNSPGAPAWPTQRVAHLAHLGGALAGWVFMRMNGYGGSAMSLDRLHREREIRESSLSDRAKSFLSSRSKNPDQPQKTKRADFISGEVDPILDKINKEGIHSLTAEERAVLERAQSEIENRSSSR